MEKHSNLMERMRTRRWVCAAAKDQGPKRKNGKTEEKGCLKRARFSPPAERGCGDFFEDLPDDLVVCILGNLSLTAQSPADFVSVLITCKRFNGLGVSPLVLSKACPRMLAVKAKNWSECAHRFLKLCVDAGNVEACFTLGMIRFYCLEKRAIGASLMAKAAIGSHAAALYSLAVIQFNGSGGSKNDKNFRAGVALCARAAHLGHFDALQELGHCLQGGYGVKRNIAEECRLCIQANARGLAQVLAVCPNTVAPSAWLVRPATRNDGGRCPVLSDFSCSVPPPAPHPANQFLCDWYSGKGPGPGKRLCSHGGCGRPETRRHEFRRCSVCRSVNYCSRACQALDWKLRHRADCVPAGRVAAIIAMGEQ